MPLPTGNLSLHQFNLDSVNSSVQNGDWVYYTPTSPIGAFDTGNGNITFFGLVYDIGSNHVIIQYDDAQTMPSITDYLIFSKHPEVNVSRLSGYYMTVNFINNSHNYAELFSVGSEISENSK